MPVDPNCKKPLDPPLPHCGNPLWCEGKGLGLGDADDTREEDGGAPIVGVNRPQFEDMWLEEIKAQWNDACLDSHP